MLVAFIVFLVAQNPEASTTAPSPLRVTDLQCEHLQNPLGVDRVPEFHWRLVTTDAQRRGQRQAAYRVQVASTATALASGDGDLWDSGKVAAGGDPYVQYAGEPLGAGRLCHWRVKSWDEAGAETPWSEPARFGVGLLTAADWQGAEWIGFDAPTLAAKEQHLDFRAARWIWCAADPVDAVPEATRWFRGELG
jgi:alpha-L-rhamnosidase